MIVRVQLNRAAIVLFVLTGVCAFPQTEPSNEQYKVYSAFLRIQLEHKTGIDDLRVGSDGSSISPKIAAFKKRLTKPRLLEIKERLSGIQTETLESLAECTSTSYRLTRRLTLPIRYVLLDPDRAVGARGYIEFSCVGMNRSQRQAAFFVSRLKCYCAVGKWVLMQKDSNGRWAISKEDIEWIA
jgi:hypothetical protein